MTLPYKKTDHGDLINPPRADGVERSPFYEKFPPPIRNMPQGNGFDFHVYFWQNNAKSVKSIIKLHDDFRREFPEIRVYMIHSKPVGPHTVGMFEINTFSPLETGVVFSWMVVNRGEHSVLIHPHTDDPVHEHSVLATWMGQPVPIDLEMLATFEELMKSGKSRPEIGEILAKRTEDLNASLDSLKL
ncbi:hypothetical protein SmJEL517_g05549 [Synchytrium microbalum]|uniref:DOPA 4,5-dioxygenase n=1 Tax=Synchytrium microbalum TaxID=1806994 RepID=A0A507BNH7_9FUNG|nr:uncharacterized protein SmJEL517_g05549 [Synchytrium microbalum]TPX31037.1 hypothetical protein SmJEL517_g05549 [Synchytrium microbalum]